MHCINIANNFKTIYDCTLYDKTYMTAKNKVKYYLLKILYIIYYLINKWLLFILLWKVTLTLLKQSIATYGTIALYNFCTSRTASDYDHWSAQPSNLWILYNIKLINNSNLDYTFNLCELKQLNYSINELNKIFVNTLIILKLS